MTQAIEHITLVRTPSGVPEEADFALGRSELAAPQDGEVLVRVIALSLDPYLRSAMAGRHMSGAIAPGTVVRGEGLVEVLHSRHPRMQAGQRWVAFCGWRSHALLDAATVAQARPVDDEVQPATLALGVLGMPGLTAWAGFKLLADAKAGDTLVVSAASGPVGATVGQLARIAGCRVVGIAGGAEKCAWAETIAGFDVCIDYKHHKLREALKTHCPGGVDIYFDNVGGDTLQAVVEQLALHARIVLCGLISQYGADAPAGPQPGFVHQGPRYGARPGGVRPLGAVQRYGGRAGCALARRPIAHPRRCEPRFGQHACGLCAAHAWRQPRQGPGATLKRGLR